MDEEIKNQQGGGEPENQNQDEQSQQSEPAAESAVVSSEAKNMGMLCHLLGLFGFIGPLIIWLIEKDKIEFVNEQGKSALNWQISLVIYFFASWILALIVIGFVLMPVLVILNIVFVVLASVKASNGESYIYPLSIKFLK